MASASLSSNKLKLNHLTINNYNRHNAYESQKQFIKSVQDYSIKTSQSPVDITDDVFSLKSLPPKHQLMKWSTELSMRNNIASGIHYIECNLGKFMYKSVQHLIALHRVQEMKLAVDQELTWFNSPKLVPKSISIFPSQNLIEKFKEVLFRRPANKEISEYGMNPNTLAELCCARWLSSDHMLQISSILNSNQGHSKVIYFNFLGNIEHYVSRITVVPEKLIFIINVGGNNEKTFSGTDLNAGCHWTLAVYNSIEGNFYYGDSLGWTAPDDFLTKVKLLIKKLYHISESFNITYCHDPKTHMNGVKKCSSFCKENYPMQTCGNICGVITIIVCAISCLKYDYFNCMINNGQIENNNYIFLKDPTKYSKYLRLVLMSWFISKEINLDFVVPTTIVREVSTSFEVCDTDSDEDAIYTNVFESNINKKNMANVKNTNFLSLKCAICIISFTQKKNMLRHMKNKHKSIDEAQENIQSGNSFCLQCGFKCRRIKDLRKHLSTVHFYTFLKEKLSFANYREFEMWKSDVESNNATQYVLPSGEKIDKDGRKISYYQCNRSGFYKCIAKKRLVKSSGMYQVNSDI
ncbi:uncharacterized protein LOC136079588 [Hydra vulgaris]|uniref:Uncharacterized protein LOC136079588 n=1 Tax=Hydra vulgaris TaxID=6087 RepID=A0ABM4BR58_HYDVU